MKYSQNKDNRDGLAFTQNQGLLPFSGIPFEPECLQTSQSGEGQQNDVWFGNDTSSEAIHHPSQRPVQFLADLPVLCYFACLPCPEAYKEEEGDLVITLRLSSGKQVRCLLIEKDPD